MKERLVSMWPTQLWVLTAKKMQPPKTNYLKIKCRAGCPAMRDSSWKSGTEKYSSAPRQNVALNLHADGS